MTLAGVQVVYDSGEEDFEGFKTFNMNKGHRVALFIRTDSKFIVRVDDRKSKVEIGGAKADAMFYSGMGVSDNRKTARIEFQTDDKVKLSADGLLEVKGTLPIALATGKERVQSTAFSVEKGTAVPFSKGEIPELKVKSIGKPRFGDGEMEIKFSTDRQMDDFAGITFTSKDGSEIESDRGNSSWMGFGKKGSGTIEYRFEKKHSDLIMEIETWTGLEEQTVTIDLKAAMKGL